MRLSKIFALAVLALTSVAALAQAPTADEAYREARRTLNRRDFPAAITQFRELRTQYPGSANVGDSYYWEAFALERTGNLEGARQALETQLREYPGASTRRDAEALQLQICSELARGGNRECAEVIAPSVRDPSQDPELLMVALNALMNMRGDRAVPIATQVLANRSHPEEVRRQALFILADKADEGQMEAQVRTTLLTTARDATDSIEIRKQAVFWLSELPGADTLNALRELMASADDEELRKSAIFAISQQETPEAAALLREIAENDSLDVESRKQAIYWLADAHEERAIPFLTELYGKLTDSELKRQVLFAVAETEADSALGWLLERAADAREPVEVRKQALFWAAEAGLPVADLRSLYRNTAERELREHLIWLIAEGEDSAALDGLIEIARTDPDPEMRKKAVFWIGESEDPRAEQFVLGVLGQGGRQ